MDIDEKRINIMYGMAASHRVREGIMIMLRRAHVDIVMEKINMHQVSDDMKSTA